MKILDGSVCIGKVLINAILASGGIKLKETLSLPSKHTGWWQALAHQVHAECSRYGQEWRLVSPGGVKVVISPYWGDRVRGGTRRMVKRKRGWTGMIYFAFGLHVSCFWIMWKNEQKRKLQSAFQDALRALESALGIAQRQPYVSLSSATLFLVHSLRILPPETVG